MAWMFLFIAGAFEIATTTVFRYTEGLSRPLPTVAFFALGLVSFYFLNRSLSGIPLGTAYAIWTGIGAAGTLIVGHVFYGEETGGIQLVLLVVLIGAIMGLKVVSPH